MKTKLFVVGPLALLGILLLQGCVAFPPLIQVEHKENPATDQEILRRLEGIESRLNQMEQKTAPH